MVRRDQAGFTLIELMLVMAITGMLLLIAFAGQRGLRARTQFDATVDKMVATVADARNEAISGVNVQGTGDGTQKCAGGGNVDDYIFAGTSWTADNLSANRVTIDYYRALRSGPNTGACVFDSRTISLPVDPAVSVAGGNGGRVLFVRTPDGGVVVCPIGNLTYDPRDAFVAGGCTTAATSVTFDLSDGDGHSSSVMVDTSGLAKRQN